ncbi:MAG TPA: multiheme c-type cytochrome [Bryobacteraceae bacterium]|nr:multiheme c-type cytochrome [Bryobacteraceae bacterium]
MSRTLISVFLLAGALDAETAWVGARVCAGCHPRQYELQARSEHARALRRATEHPLADSFPEQHIAYRPPDYRLSWTRSRNRIINAVFDGERETRIDVEWAFGAGQQAVTFVSQLDEDGYIEHHLSWYASTKSLAATPGHRALRSASAVEALGVVYATFAPDSAILRCFQCHSTGRLQLRDGLRVEPSEPGVRCEACHGPGAAHVKARGRAGIVNPAKLESSAMYTLCGTCHRPPASDANSIDWTDAWNVRHQPVYLSRSMCFEMSAGRLRCTTCHDPHVELERSAVSYNARCRSCHQLPAHAAAAGSDCVGCHMPKVKPQPNLAFTNHWIGVFSGSGAESLLRPRDHRLRPARKLN